jgi:hypothetical protein
MCLRRACTTFTVTSRRAYQAKIKAWWFDSPYSLDPRGPHNSVTTDVTSFQFPWERFTVAAKVGHPARLVTLDADPAAKYPRCTAGKRACPPEDCGGPWSYDEFLEAISDPKHDDHDDLLEWVGGEFDAEKFDLNGVNKELSSVR